MSLTNRLDKLEEQLTKTAKAKGEVIIRWVGCDGYYPEAEQDKESNNTIIKVSVIGVSYEELKSWAQ